LPTRVDYLDESIQTTEFVSAIGEGKLRQYDEDCERQKNLTKTCHQE